MQANRDVCNRLPCRRSRSAPSDMRPDGPPPPPLPAAADDDPRPGSTFLVPDCWWSSIRCVSVPVRVSLLLLLLLVLPIPTPLCANVVNVILDMVATATATTANAWRAHFLHKHTHTRAQLNTDTHTDARALYVKLLMLLLLLLFLSLLLLFAFRLYDVIVLVAHTLNLAWSQGLLFWSLFGCRICSQITSWPQKQRLALPQCLLSLREHCTSLHTLSHSFFTTTFAFRDDDKFINSFCFLLLRVAVVFSHWQIL